MSRGLTAGQIAVLNNSSVIVEDLVEIILTNVSQSFFYTTGSYPLTVTTPTSSTQSFTPNSFISDLGSLTETYEFSPQPITLTFERLASGGDYDDFINQLNASSWTNSRVTIYKLFRDSTTLVPDTTNGLFNMFTGKITNYQTLYDEATTTYQLTCSNAYSDNRVRGRNTGNIYGALNGKKLYWGRFTKP